MNFHKMPKQQSDVGRFINIFLINRWDYVATFLSLIADFTGGKDTYRFAILRVHMNDQSFNTLTFYQIK